jgi:sugar phosphate isomerase/epimerase
MSLDRRAFLAAACASLAAPAACTSTGAPAVLRARGSKKRYPIAFSTLGCPAWDWNTIVETAARLGYAALELRGIGGEMDLTKVPELTGSRLGGTKKDLAALGLAVSDLGSNARMHKKDPAQRQAQFDEGRRFIDLAQAMGVKYVRMFGDEVPQQEAREDVSKRVVEGFREMAAYARRAGVVVLIESHGDFTRSKDLVEILTAVNDPAFALLWDAHHTFVSAQEQPAESWAAFGAWVRHVHLKDSKREDGKRRYVLLGAGEVPVKEQVAVLARNGYTGYYCLEWEKRWHPEIEEPEVAFPHYAKTMAEYLSAAGVKEA